MGFFRTEDRAVTVKELRDWLADKPDDGEVWLTNYGTGQTNACCELAPLNAGTDVLLSPAEKPKCNHDFQVFCRDKGGAVAQCSKCGTIGFG